MAGLSRSRYPAQGPLHSRAVTWLQSLPHHPGLAQGGADQASAVVGLDCPQPEARPQRTLQSSTSCQASDGQHWPGWARAPHLTYQGLVPKACAPQGAVPAAPRPGFLPTTCQKTLEGVHNPRRYPSQDRRWLDPTDGHLYELKLVTSPSGPRLPQVQRPMGPGLALLRAEEGGGDNAYGRVAQPPWSLGKDSRHKPGISAGLLPHRWVSQPHQVGNDPTQPNDQEGRICTCPPGHHPAAPPSAWQQAVNLHPGHTCRTPPPEPAPPSTWKEPPEGLRKSAGLWGKSKPQTMLPVSGGPVLDRKAWGSPTPFFTAKGRLSPQTHGSSPPIVRSTAEGANPARATQSS